MCESRSVSAGARVLELERDLDDAEPGTVGVDRHRRLHAEARGDARAREDLSPERALPRQWACHHFPSERADAASRKTFDESEPARIRRRRCCDRQIRLSGKDRLEQLARDPRGPSEVAVDEQNDGGLCLGQSGAERTTLPRTVLEAKDRGTGFLRTIGRPIAGRVVHDDYLRDVADRAQRTHCVGDVRGFITCRNDHGHVSHYGVGATAVVPRRVP